MQRGKCIQPAVLATAGLTNLTALGQSPAFFKTGMIFIFIHTYRTMAAAVAGDKPTSPINGESRQHKAINTIIAERITGGFPNKMFSITKK